MSLLLGLDIHPLDDSVIGICWTCARKVHHGMCAVWEIFSGVLYILRAVTAESQQEANNMLFQQHSPQDVGAFAAFVSNSLTV